MRTQYAIVNKVKDRSVKAALHKALRDDGRISTLEVSLIIKSTHDYKQLTYQEFKDLQTILREARTLNNESKSLVRTFLLMSYHAYLAQRKKKTSIRVPYKVDHIPKTLARRPGDALNASYITIHSTGNPKSSATGERGWLTNAQNTRSASYHIVVDETQAIECIPLNEQAWHAGTAAGNKSSIGVEICESGDRKKTLQNAAALTAKLLRDRSLGVDAMKMHNDWSGKNCPRILRDPKLRTEVGQTWDWFKSEVKQAL